jgi:hypothetical protein
MVMMLEDNRVGLLVNRRVEVDKVVRARDMMGRWSCVWVLNSSGQGMYVCCFDNLLVEFF